MQSDHDHHPHPIAALLKADSFEHPVDDIKLVETHISWVILTGQFAYKIKKPVDLGFVDFSSLEKRVFTVKRKSGSIGASRLTSTWKSSRSPARRAIRHS